MKGFITIPGSVRKSVNVVQCWLNKNGKGLDIQPALKKMAKIPIVETSVNPIVIIDELIRTDLVAYIIISLSNGRSKYSVRWGQGDLDEHVKNLENDGPKVLRDVIFNALDEQKVFGFNIDLDDVPDPREYKDLYKDAISNIPVRTELVLRDKSLLFTDSRLAGLYVVVNKCSNEHEVILNCDDEAVSDDEWDDYDIHQWDQLQKECKPSARWEKIIECARKVVSQKRIKILF